MASAVTAAFVLSVLAAWALVRLAPRFARIDAVGERSLHSSPTPRAGGLAFVAAVSPDWLPLRLDEYGSEQPMPR